MYFRWEVCTTATQARFSAKVSQLYANSNEGKRTRTQTSKLVENLRHSFQDLLEAADWMDKGRKHAFWSYIEIFLLSVQCQFHSITYERHDPFHV